MEYYDQSYLDLFKQVNTQKIENSNQSYEQLRGNDNSFNSQMLKETPDYTNYNNNYSNFNNQNLNEVRRQEYSQDFNINEFNIETRVNGQSINEVKQEEKGNKLNEVMQKLRDERLNEIKQSQERQSLNENIDFSNSDYISVEMFEKARYNSMMQVANRINPR